MKIKKPSNNDKREIRTILKKNGINNIIIEKKEWHLSIIYKPSILSILTTSGYSIDNNQTILYIYIPKKRYFNEKSRETEN